MLATESEPAPWAKNFLAAQLQEVHDAGPDHSFGHLITPLGPRVTEAGGIRLSTRKVYKVGTLEWKLTGLVNPEVEFDIANRSGRSRAVRWCRDIS